MNSTGTHLGSLGLLERTRHVRNSLGSGSGQAPSVSQRKYSIVDRFGMFN
jgi:hypothetical protein